MKSDLYQKGLKQLRKQFGPNVDDYIEKINAISPEFAELNVEFPYGKIYTRTKELSTRIRELVTLAALTATGFGNSEQMQYHTNAALKSGATQQEVIEVILQMTAYCGFPATTAALLKVNEVFKSISVLKK